MHMHFTRTCRGKKGFAVLKPLLMILVFMILAAALLIGMEALGSGTSPMDWSWVLYIGAGLVLFAIFAFRSRNRVPLSDKTDQVDPAQMQTGGDEETCGTLDEVRRRIRQRKTDKLL